MPDVLEVPEPEVRNRPDLAPDLAPAPGQAQEQMSGPPGAGRPAHCSAHICSASQACSCRTSGTASLSDLALSPFSHKVLGKAAVLLADRTLRRLPVKIVGPRCHPQSVRLVALLVALTLSTACGPLLSHSPLPAETPVQARQFVRSSLAPRAATSGRAVRVIDGDTLLATLKGRRISIRLIGVDAPERPDCFGHASTTALARLVPPGTPLRVATDAEPFDPYGRHLLYVWTAHGTFVNLAQIRDGQASAMVLPPNDQHADLFLAAESAARRARTGHWSACG